MESRSHYSLSDHLLTEFGNKSWDGVLLQDLNAAENM